ncbi:aldo/keto reductase [Spirulina sp. CS-785/01]|uniref:aldo/keto reductase n=1 Tax=Spirulina sp. CS-785/01 TaxID=3021716 RepID=UPI00232D0A9A|nr:aldo/keto reductase [Spirulina sp. CS-785/01]MDB9314608.1 aldo/keto reductase [Spirulina sp. CS-785/01]
MNRPIKRRKFLITGAVTTGVVIGGSILHKTLTSADADTPVTSSTTPSEKANSQPVPPTGIPERVLGKTGVSVPILGLGGAGQTPLSWTGREKEAIAMIETALQEGIRYFDTAASYGPSEGYLGKILPSMRQDIFLASKTAKLDRDNAWRELERSLKRLNTDYLDLWQMHHISFMDELDQITGNNGAAKAIEEAKDQKLIRFVGITGHHEPDVIAEGLRRYPFDTALIPVNAADSHHPRPFIPEVLPVAQENNVGIIAMKVPAYGRLFKPGVLDGMQQAFGYSLSQQGVHTAIIAAETPEQLISNINVARQFQPLSEPELAQIAQQTANAWEDNTFFRAWT